MTAKSIPLAGVIGQNIGYSKSPRLHGYWLKKYGLPGHYVPMDVATSDLPHVLNILPKMGFKGVNITIPHKEPVLDFADVISDRAALIGAANTLTFQADGKLYADNTDGTGFIANIRQNAPDWKPDDAPAFVLGSGGAARAVVAALLDQRAPEILIANRTRARADALKAHFGAKITVVDWNQAGRNLSEVGTLINTTSLGMVGKEELKLSLDELSPTAIVNDIVYTPLETALLQTAQARGNPTIDGLGMLLHQAVPGFERWFGHRPEVDEGLRQTILL